MKIKKDSKRIFSRKTSVEIEMTLITRDHIVKAQFKEIITLQAIIHGLSILRNQQNKLKNSLVD